MSIWSAIVLLAAAAVEAANPLPHGTVTVSVIADGDGRDGEAAAFAEAVGTAFNATGFLVLPPAGPSRYRARVAIRREDRGMVAAPAGTAGPNVGLGNWGAGVRITLPTHKQDLRALVVTRMTITLVDWRDGRALWSGTAVTAQVGGAPANAPSVIGTKLADALVSRMPAVLDGPLSVP